MKTKWFWVY